MIPYQAIYLYSNKNKTTVSNLSLLLGFFLLDFDIFRTL